MAQLSVEVGSGLADALETVLNGVATGTRLAVLEQAVGALHRRKQGAGEAEVLAARKEIDGIVETMIRQARAACQEAFPPSVGPNLAVCCHASLVAFAAQLRTHQGA